MNVTLKVLFTKMERYLLRNNQVFVLNSDSESPATKGSSSDDGENFRDSFMHRKLVNSTDYQVSPYFDKILAGALRKRLNENSLLFVSDQVVSGKESVKDPFAIASS